MKEKGISIQCPFYLFSKSIGQKVYPLHIITQTSFYIFYYILCFTSTTKLEFKVQIKITNIYKKINKETK